MAVALPFLSYLGRQKYSAWGPGIGAYITKKGETKVLYHQISEGPPHPGEGDWISKGGELEMSPTQLNFGSRSEMVKIKTPSMSVVVHSNGLRMHS